MKIKCMLDQKQYQNKPQGKEIGAITNRLVSSNVEIEINELAEGLTRGQTFKPSYLNGKKESDWMEQQLFALDFDHATTIEEVINKCKELNILPCFGYTSFNHLVDKNDGYGKEERFRLVFCTDEVITDYDTALKLQLTLMNIFDKCDEKCKNLSRLYFGGHELIYFDENNRIDYKEILNKYFIKVDGKKTPQENIDNVSNTSNLLGRKTSNTQTQGISIDIEHKYYNIKALRNRDVEYLKNKINNPHIILENNQAFFDYIKRYDLANLLEINYPTSFRCILHEDNHPSAGIFQNEEGTYIYHCFSCGVSYNIINLIEVLGNFKSRPKAYKFIKEIFNLEIMDTEWQKEQKELIKENRRVLLDGELEKNCPNAYKNIKRNIRYLEQLFLIAEDNVYSEKFTDNDDNVVFYASTKYICKMLGMSEESAKEVSKKNVLFAYHGLLNKIDDKDAPEEMLKRSQAIGANDENKYRKHINYYSIPSYTTNLFEDIENQGQKWKDNNYTMKGLSREMFYRAEGQKMANNLYPQYKQVVENKQIIDRTTTNKSNLRTDKIVEIIFDIFTIKNWVTEKEIVNELVVDSEAKLTKGEAEKQIKKSLKEILDGYGLKRIRCNKEIKEQYNVDANGYPFLIVKN